MNTEDQDKIRNMFQRMPEGQLIETITIAAVVVVQRYGFSKLESIIRAWRDAEAIAQAFKDALRK